MMLVWMFLLAAVGLGEGERLAGECGNVCNEMMLDVLTASICAEAKRTTPIPKLGSFCSMAMERGYRDACLALCMDRKPTYDIAQACRTAAIELPRPTVRTWCEHGYREAFYKTSKDLVGLFLHERNAGTKAPTRNGAPVPGHGGGGGRAASGDAGSGGSGSSGHSGSGSGSGGGSGSNGARGGDMSLSAVYQGSAVALAQAEGEDVEDVVVAYCRGLGLGGADTAKCIRAILPQVMPGEL